MRTCKAPLTRRRKRQARANVIGMKAWEIREDLRLAHPAGQILQNIVDGDARAFDARLTAPHARCDRDTIFETHGTRLFKVPPRCKAPHYLRSKRTVERPNRRARLELAALGRTEKDGGGRGGPAGIGWDERFQSHRAFGCRCRWDPGRLVPIDVPAGPAPLYFPRPWRRDSASFGCPSRTALHVLFFCIIAACGGPAHGGGFRWITRNMK